jgi:hypothetical protein
MPLWVTPPRIWSKLTLWQACFWVRFIFTRHPWALKRGGLDLHKPLSTFSGPKHFCLTAGTLLIPTRHISCVFTQTQFDTYVARRGPPSVVSTWGLNGRTQAVASPRKACHWPPWDTHKCQSRYLENQSYKWKDGLTWFPLASTLFTRNGHAWVFSKLGWKIVNEHKTPFTNNVTESIALCQWVAGRHGNWPLEKTKYFCGPFCF